MPANLAGAGCSLCDSKVEESQAKSVWTAEIRGGFLYWMGCPARTIVHALPSARCAREALSRLGPMPFPCLRITT